MAGRELRIEVSPVMAENGIAARPQP